MSLGEVQLSVIYSCSSFAIDNLQQKSRFAKDFPQKVLLICFDGILEYSFGDFALAPLSDFRGDKISYAQPRIGQILQVTKWFSTN